MTFWPAPIYLRCSIPCPVLPRVLDGVHGGVALILVIPTSIRRSVCSPIIEACSPGPRLELFARGPRKDWTVWGNQSEEYTPTWDTYSNHSQSGVVPVTRVGDRSIGVAAAVPRGVGPVGGGGDAVSKAVRRAVLEQTAGDFAQRLRGRCGLLRAANETVAGIVGDGTRG